jgi:sulfite reductase (NADPH) flavoprotein alpha-component
MCIPVLNLAARPLTILFASETGNAAALAERAAAHALAIGAAVRLRDMATYNTSRLEHEHDIVAISSTHGEGDPPETAIDFFEFLDEAKLDLRPVRFAVLALGDSGYSDFCEAGKRLDSRLEAMGAIRFAPRQDIDVGEMKAARAWLSVVVQQLVEDQAAPDPLLRGAAGQSPALAGFRSIDGPK